VCVIPTHYGGSSVDMDELKRVCGNVTVIEDAALSFGAEYKNKPLGSVGGYGIVSFHKTKNVSAEQGGALLVNGADEGVIKRLQNIYDNGTDRQAFLNGEVDAYSWQSVGQNVSMPNINAAVLAAQLKKADEIKTDQKKVCEYYVERLGGIDGLRLPAVPEYNSDNYHLFYMLLKDNETREMVRKAPEEKGIGAHFHYTPLHASAMGHRLGYKPEDLPAALSVSERLLRLPMYAGMTAEQRKYVADCILEALG